MQWRMEMMSEVGKEHGELLCNLEQIIDCSFIRVNVHYQYALDQYNNWKQSGDTGDDLTAYYLMAGCFLAERACYTANAISSLLWQGYADAAYELCRTLHNVALNLGELSKDETDKTADRYLSSALAEAHYQEQQIRYAGEYGEHSDDMWQNLQDLTKQLANEYGDSITRLDGWIEDRDSRKLRDRAESLGLLVAHEIFYEEAGKLTHASSVSMFKRPSIGLNEMLNSSQIITARPSTTGIDQVAGLVAFYLPLIVNWYIYGTDQVEISDDWQWEKDSAALQGIIMSIAGVDLSSTGSE